MRIKLAYIVSDLDKAITFEWISKNIDIQRFELIFILINKGNSYLEDFLRANNTKVYRITYLGKKGLPSNLLQCMIILTKEKVKVVHCHLFEACLIGLSAALFVGIKKRIYTRHHSTLHHTNFPSAVKYDKLINRLSTNIIAISLVIMDVLTRLEGVNKEKITIVNHGFDLEAFKKKDKENLDKLTVKYNPESKKPVIGVISRYIDWKGVQFIIPAFKNILIKYPSAYLVLANSQGPYSSVIKKLLVELPAGSYKEISFENDLFSLYHLFDYFVHVPVDNHSEAFGQVYIESIAAGIPSVFTLSGIACEVIEHGRNALVVDYKDEAGISTAVLQLIENEKLSDELVANGLNDIKARFNLKTMVNGLEKVYGV